MKRACFPFVAAALLTFGGCATQSNSLDALYGAYEKDRVAHYQEAIRGSNVSALVHDARSRNELINDFILLIDHQYARTEAALYRRKSWADFGGSVLATGLGTASTLSGAVGVKTTLSALVTALDSTRVSFDHDILQGQSTIAIIATMRKMRAEKLLEIRFAEKLSLRAYPLSMALNDLMAYYHAGTTISALQSMTEDASAAKKVADARLKSLKSENFTPRKTQPRQSEEVIAPAETSAVTPTPASSGSAVPDKTAPAQPEGVISPAD